MRYWFGSAREINYFYPASFFLLYFLWLIYFFIYLLIFLSKIVIYILKTGRRRYYNINYYIIYATANMLLKLGLLF
jgi:hypothetical protein